MKKIKGYLVLAAMLVSANGYALSPAAEEGKALLRRLARTADVLSTVVLFPLMMLGGSFFPFEAMQEPLRTWGQFTPNGWALMRLKEILGGDVTAASFGAR